MVSTHGTHHKVGKVCRKHPGLCGLRYKVQHRCVGCAMDSARAWKTTNSDKVRAIAARAAKKWRDANPEDSRASSAKWKATNANAVRRYQRDKRLADLPGDCVKVARRKAAKLQATPRWADLGTITVLYELADAYRRAGFSCHVDHIVPLRHSEVCGLHTEHNLQLLPAAENLRKGNRYFPRAV